MNRFYAAGLLLNLGAGVLAGAALSWGEAIRRSELKYRKEYEAQLMSHTRALRHSYEINIFSGETPAETEDELEIECPVGEPHVHKGDDIVVGGEMVIQTAFDVDQYIEQARVYDNGDVFLGESALSLEYIEDEDYHEEDGRPKEQITIFMDGEMPLFFMDGQPIEDWAERIGDSILVDFYTMVPPGAERVLYVRNNKRDEDYEVIQEVNP